MRDYSKVTCPATAVNCGLEMSANSDKISTMESVTVRDSFTDAIRFWEPRRVIYNLVLAVIVIASALVTTGPFHRDAEAVSPRSASDDGRLLADYAVPFQP